jgi:hypothetical protein
VEKHEALRLKRGKRRSHNARQTKTTAAAEPAAVLSKPREEQKPSVTVEI